MLQRRTLISFLVAVMSVSVTVAEAEIITGNVVSIADGDTCTVLVDGQQVKVRLEGMDAPEKGQPYGDKAKQELSGLAFDKSVTVVTTGKDRYGRTLGRVFVDLDGESIDVNARLVAQGFAWRYVKYSDDPNLIAAEEAARRDRRGLWADPSPVAPWDWRKDKRG
jgi:micrococcal nuclease